MKARLADIAAARRRQRGDGQPCAQRQARGGRVDPAGSAHRARRPGLRPADPAAAQERRARRPDRPELTNPIFPTFAQIIETALARQRLHPGAVHPDAGRRPRGRVRPDAARPRRRRDHLRLGPARRHHDRPRALRQAARARPADRPGQRLPSRASTRPSSPTTTSPRWSSRSSHLVALGHTQIGLAIGPDRYVPVIRKITGLPQLDEVAARAATTSRTSSSARCSRSRAATAAATRLIEKGARRSSAARTSWRWARSGPRDGVGLEVPRRLLRGGLRRLDAHRVHRPAADDSAPERAGDERGRGAGPARRDRRASRRPGRSTSSAPSSSCAARPGPAGRADRVRWMA